MRVSKYIYYDISIATRKHIWENHIRPYAGATSEVK